MTTSTSLNPSQIDSLLTSSFLSLLMTRPITPSDPLNLLHSPLCLPTPSLYLWCTQNSEFGLTTLTSSLAHLLFYHVPQQDIALPHHSAWFLDAGSQLVNKFSLSFDPFFLLSSSVVPLPFFLIVSPSEYHHAPTSLIAMLPIG